MLVFLPLLQNLDNCYYSEYNGAAVLAAPITAHTDMYTTWCCVQFLRIFHIYKQVPQSGLNNEQFIEPHAFLIVNDLAPPSPAPPSVSSTNKT
jgi:hypothetical protein